LVEEIFHQDSYAYRANRSALDAVLVCRARCFKHDWLVEIDIRRFFDELDHDIALQILQKHTGDKLTLLYVKKFLQASGITRNGEKQERTKGTPQGGVISPVLANLYLHEIFDEYMSARFPKLKFERYADDIVIHCVSEKQANFVKGQIDERLKKFKLEMHPEKSKVVYTGTKNDHDKRGHDLSRKFTFLGYDFKPRMWRGHLVYSPGIGKGALKMIRHKIKEGWRLKNKIGSTLHQIAKEVNPVIRGWINYYGQHRRSDLYRLQHLINNHIVRFLKKKHDCATWGKAWKYFNGIKKMHTKLFVHWYMISLSK